MAEKDLSIVTGASRGIGKGIALKLASENHNVMIFGRDKNALIDVQKQIKDFGVESEYFIGDAVDVDFVKDSVKNILAKYKKVDHLINNAGTGVFKKIVDAELKDFQKQINVNLYGVFNFTNAVLPGMIKQMKGSIITIASLAGKNSFVGGAMYSSSKHAVLGFMRSLMLEVREYNIRSASICPGSVDTDFGLSRKKQILETEDVADAVLAVIKLPVRALMSEIDLRPTNPK